LRHVKRITGLYDVSIVTHPAYEQTSVGTREAGNEIDKAIDRQIEADNKQREAEDPKKDEEAEREERELEEQAERARVMMMQRLRWQRRHNEEYFK
jgi:phage head maturation protease